MRSLGTPLPLTWMGGRHGISAREEFRTGLWDSLEGGREERHLHTLWKTTSLQIRRSHRPTLDVLRATLRATLRWQTT